jgi:hypothetical protein
MWIEEGGKRMKIFERWFYFNPCPQEKNLFSSHARHSITAFH